MTQPPRVCLSIGLVSAGLCGVAALSGCYDGASLVEQARAEAVYARLEEVDLGSYNTTLPRSSQSTTVTEMHFKIFGTTPRYRVPAIEEQLETGDYRLRYAILTAVRQASAAELAEPDLTALRQRVRAVVNELLADAPLESIGLAEVRLVRH